MTKIKAPHIPTTGHMKAKRKNQADAEKWRAIVRATSRRK